MLPLLRVLPVGGVFFAILTLILALTPPHRATPALHRVAIDARGPLQDRDDHPEWRQFIMMAAYRRAEAVSKLGDLPSAPTKLPEIMMPVPPAPPITMTAEPAAAPAVALAPAENAPAPAAEKKPVELASLPVAAIEAPPITITAATEQTAPAISPADVGLPAAETQIAVPLPNAAPAELRKVSGVPVERIMTDPAPEDATGSIDTHPGATIPIEIGETSSTEMPIVLPPERPPVLRNPKRPLTRAKRPAKPQPRKQMGLLDLWLAHHQSAASPAAKPTEQAQTRTQAQPQTNQ